MPKREPSSLPPTLWTYAGLARDLNLDAPRCDGCITHLGLYPAQARPDTLYVHYLRSGDPAPAREALARGAAVLTRVAPEEIGAEGPVFQVESVSAALQTLAGIGRSRCRGEALAITGSVGKSSIRNMAMDVLGGFGVVHGWRANENGDVGVAAMTASTPPETDFIVAEISATGLGTLAPRAALAAPSIAVVNVAAYSHVEKYPSEAALLQEKLSLLDHLTGAAIAVLGRDLVERDCASADRVSRLDIGRLITVGTAADDHVRLLDVTSTATSVTLTASIEGRICRADLPVSGRHFGINAAFALGVAHALGLDIELAAGRLGRFRPPERRTQRLRIDRGLDGAFELIDDAANANPASTRAVLDILRLRRPARKILVFADMRELGRQEMQLHADLAPDVADCRLDLLVTVGSLAGCLAATPNLAGEVVAVDTAEEAAAVLTERVQPGDLVVLKGSAAMRLGTVAAALKALGRCAAAGAWTVDPPARPSAPSDFS